ncbi:MAG: hypothetical protein HZB50_18050 [Chloroflexi bacterium]|nr:hypothetical protein [Chloroflexota bacterium]
MQKTAFENSVKFTLIICSILIATSCSIGIRQNESLDMPEDMPLSEFIIGRWKYEGKHKFESSEYIADVFWEYTFVDETNLLIWTGNDGGTCTYKFIEAELISIDCSPRMIELMTWSVKRDDQDLLIQRLDSESYGDGELLRFERIPIR